MTVEWRRAALRKLRPRDFDALRALCEHPEKQDALVAATIGMAASTFKSRLRFIRRVLQTETRAQLQAEFGCLVGQCCCTCDHRDPDGPPPPEVR